MEIKTCEEYVLNELNNALTKNENLVKRLEELCKDNFNLKLENDKLKQLIKKIINKSTFEDIGNNHKKFYVFMYNWDDEEKEIIEELKKYRGDENDRETNA